MNYSMNFNHSKYPTISKVIYILDTATEPPCDERSKLSYREWTERRKHYMDKFY
jgi:hypothetical protein